MQLEQSCCLMRHRIRMYFIHIMGQLRIADYKRMESQKYKSYVFEMFFSSYMSWNFNKVQGYQVSSAPVMIFDIQDRCWDLFHIQWMQNGTNHLGIFFAGQNTVCHNFLDLSLIIRARARKPETSIKEPSVERPMADGSLQAELIH